MDSICVCFEMEFGNEKEKLVKCCVFVEVLNGEIIGMVMFWDGNIFGEMVSWIYWVVVFDLYGGKGIVKVLLFKIFGLNKSSFVYLIM